MTSSVRASVIFNTSSVVAAACQTAFCKKKYYAVVAGYKPGIYETWKECEQQVKGFKGQIYKSFGSKVKAEEYMATKKSRCFPAETAKQLASKPADFIKPNALEVSQVDKLFKSSSRNPLISNVTSSVLQIVPDHYEALQVEAETEELELDQPMQPTTIQPCTYNDAACNSISDVDVLYQLEFDGASKGNPGRAGAGALLRHPDGTAVCEVSVSLGTATNNVAEYKGLIFGMRKALALGVERIQAQGDSKLVAMQIQGKWKIKNENLALLYKEAMDLLNNFKEFKICHVDREFNTSADALANKGIASWRYLTYNLVNSATVISTFSYPTFI